MTRSQADVTVVIPTVGMSRFLRDAVESALADAPAEIVVVNDGAEEIAFRGARVVRIEHAGRSAARNRGVEEARTELVAFLDDDDLVLPGRFARQAEALGDAPLTFGRVEVVDGEGRPQPDWNELLDSRFPGGPVGASEIVSAQTPIYTSATLVRRGAFLEAGGYDPALDAYEDLDLYLRLACLGPLVPTPGGPVALYRLHGENTPSDRLYEGMLAVTEKHLPESHGPLRRALLERRIDALWGLGRLRGEALRAAFLEPLLLTRRRFVLRLAGSMLPRRR
jgi:glycosyltransferase involved in cell wall biosynthesis